MRLNEKIFSNLLNTIVTLEDSTLFQEELRLLSESMYSGKGLNFETMIANRVRRSVALALKADLKMAAMETTAFVQSAMDFFNRLPVVELALGFEPTAEQIVTLAQTARELAGQPVLLSITYKPYLIGGAEFNYQGEYRDYSLRTRMQALFNEQPKVLK